jgi:hypothetical protein
MSESMRGATPPLFASYQLDAFYDEILPLCQRLPVPSHR